MDIKDLYALFEAHPVVTTDSRDCPGGSIFFALKGTSFDGNKFAGAALEKGCAFAVVDEAEYVPKDDNRYILVNDALKALQDLAHYHREKLETRVIEITGTNGKTTTKELTSAVLSQAHNVLYTQGNLNNQIGVPKTLLRLTKEHDLAVIETGASHPGDIKELADIVDPDYGIITNVGKAHIAGFGSFEGVIKTKGELYDYLRAKKDTVVFINNDNPYLNKIAGGLHLVRYGKEKDCPELSVYGEVIECNPFLKFRWKKEKSSEWNTVQTHLIGSYNVDNALAAVTIGLYFAVTPAQINEALENYQPTNNRSELVKTASNTLIVDAYNANPTSMEAALQNFALIKGEKKMVILGDMKELGSISREEHQKIVDKLNAHPDYTVWLIGPEFSATTHDSHIRTFQNEAEVAEEIKRQKPEGYTILIKGSNSMKLFELPKIL